MFLQPMLPLLAALGCTPPSPHPDLTAQLEAKVSHVLDVDVSGTLGVTKNCDQNDATGREVAYHVSAGGDFNHSYVDCRESGRVFLFDSNYMYTFRRGWRRLAGGYGFGQVNGVQGLHEIFCGESSKYFSHECKDWF